MATDALSKELIDREKAFWNAIKDMDANRTADMTADGCIVVGAQGVGKINPTMMAEMVRKATWQLHHYTFDEKGVQVRMIGDHVAILAYKVSEDITVDGEELTLEAHDSSVWVKEGDRWLCALHTESPAGDPFGRDRK